MKFVTKEDYDKKCKEDKYFVKRWNYYKEVIEIAKNLNPLSILELGCSYFPLC